jgi:hypothetical protein
MCIATTRPNQTKLRRSDMPPRWGLTLHCRVAGYNHAAPTALDALRTVVDALTRLQAETAAK